ncbi:MAG: asparagine synthase-related protein [Sphingomicrobium sp.]
MTADVRLDNRDELIATLDLGGETRTIGDGELILRAYVEWGEDCPKHLLGDFAFAIWDPREERLFCARDHMGMRQFNYCFVPGRAFVFATEDKAVLVSNTVPKTLNEGRIADLIADLEGYDFTSTFFEDIHRLTPAHCLTIDTEGFNIRRYWRFPAPPPLLLASDEAYAAAFMTIFTEAVRCRLRHSGGIGSMLSGGLDSSSITAVAAGILSARGEEPLKTFSAVGDDPTTCPETQAIQAALAIEGIKPILVAPADYHSMADELIGELERESNPFEVHGTMLRGLYRTARRNRVNIVLDGAASDVILNAGNRIADCLARGRFYQVYREISGGIRFWKPGSPIRFGAKELLSAAWVAFVPKRIRAVRRTRQMLRPWPGMSPELARRVRFSERRRDADRHVRIVADEAVRRAQPVFHPNLVSGRERLDQMAASFGVESRDPFMDIRLIRFCLSLPPSQLEADGWPKLILRRAIERMVPAAIAWRSGKEHLGWGTTAKLLDRWPGWREEMIFPLSPLHRYLDNGALKEQRDDPNASPSGLILRLFALDRFLRRYGVGS